MKKATFMRGGAIITLLLSIAALFVAGTLMVSANTADAARQCDHLRQSAGQKAEQDWQHYEQSVQQEKQTFEQSISKDKDNAQKMKQDQQLYLANLQKIQTYFTQQAKKDAAVASACKGKNSPLSTMPTAPVRDLTPPPLPTQASTPKPVPTASPSPTLTQVPTAEPTTQPTVLPTTPPVPVPTQSTGGSGNSNEQQLKMQLFALINSGRQAKGLAAYILNDTLSNGAYQHDLTMASPQCGALMHQCPGEPSPSQRVTNEGINWTTTGENIGDADYPDHWQGVQTIHQQMVAEGPGGGHYENLFRSAFHQIGIGILIDAKGTVWVTEDFTN